MQLFRTVEMVEVHNVVWVHYTTVGAWPGLKCLISRPASCQMGTLVPTQPLTLSVGLVSYIFVMRLSTRPTLILQSVWFASILIKLAFRLFFLTPSTHLH